MVNTKENEMQLAKRIREEAIKAWKNSPSLTAVSVLMLAACLASVAGLVLDARVITGAPVWLKPAKFAFSTALYAGTMAWFFQYLTIWPRLVRRLGDVTAAVILLEVGIIDVQAARGTTSHFNVASTLDLALWGIMGAAIGVLWLASMGVTVALLRQRFKNRAFGWALRLGMLITVVGAASGGMMTTPTQEQRIAIAQTGQSPSIVGGHTVGAKDGGPGLLVVDWSSRHGDLRIPHFLGLHGMQILPLLYWLQTRRREKRSDARQIQIVFLSAASYLMLFAILVWQALRGQSLIEPDAATKLALGSWLVLTGSAFLLGEPRESKLQTKSLRVS